MSSQSDSPQLISFHKVGENRGSPRLWLESRRLETLGFSAGTAFVIEPRTRGVCLRTSQEGTHHVAQRRAAGGVRPIIDVVNRSLLASLARWGEVKIAGATGLINVTPSVRAFTIHRQCSSIAPWRTLEVFAGGGTLSAAIGAHRDFRLVAGVEIEPRFADVWQASHRDALLIQADVRRIHPREYPAHEVLVAAIPCTSHSPLGRAKKSLGQKPELGDTGDLFLCIAALVATHLPLACVFENVPSFGSSLAGQTLAHHLQQLGYHITQTILDPHKEWAEPQDRRRWLMVATLVPDFTLQPPNVPFDQDLSDILDPPSECDRGEAERIAGSIAALRRHRERHRALGHGFGFTTITAQSSRVPTIVRSYHKINVGPFVETAFGPRLLRKHEVEKLMGCTIACEHYATAIEILGQGVQTRVFSEVLTQLAAFLRTVRR
ncbi:MAG TPA: DNA cytosine methyltransferase [Chthoniobacterales bacterium]|nr:DNA cytosine methyltransferase [Chthoniobacterales bacterium]